MHCHNHVFHSMSSPTTRSRTGLFLSFRDSIARFSRSRPTYEDTDEHDRLIDSPSHVTLNVQLPPQWFAC
jgi:syntaxin 16